MATMLMPAVKVTSCVLRLLNTNLEFLKYRSWFNGKHGPNRRRFTQHPEWFPEHKNDSQRMSLTSSISFKSIHNKVLKTASYFEVCH